jgi:3-oxoacyl-[acyl-carrier protein] reductase
VKTVLIFGASTDIGVSLSEYLRDKGWNVISTYNKNRINIPGIEFFKCDVRSGLDITNAIKSVIDRYGRIDMIINMAAISMDSEFLDKTKEEFMRVLEVNLVGAFLASQVYSKYIEDGLIVNIASTDGIDTYSQYNIDYAASKAGLINLSKSVSICTTNKVLCICPNWIDSETTRDMDPGYLESELNRIEQPRLITVPEISKAIYDIINSPNKSGDVFRIDIKDDKLWTEKI